MKPFIEESPKFCSFCGKSSKEVSKLIIGPGVFICDECVMSCYEIVLDSVPKVSTSKIPTPLEIYKELNRHVISQERAKKVLAVAVYNHYKRVTHNYLDLDIKIEKSNILMVGPTGTGKTLLAQTIANFLDVPFAIADASTLTEAGYVGEDVENILLRLIEDADYDIEKAQRGIIYIDEFDKIARKSESPSITRDVSGEGVQNALLKILEGTVANVPAHGGRKDPYRDYIQIDTKDILFICGGAFSGLKKNNTKPIGFERKVEEKDDKLTPQDFIRYGIIPECMGRLQVIVELDELTRDDLVRILTEPVNAITKQYQKLFELDGVKLEFEKEALFLIADEAIKRNTGARGLRTILEEILLDTMFEIPSRKYEKCLVTSGSVLKKSKPLMYSKKQVV